MLLAVVQLYSHQARQSFDMLSNINAVQSFACEHFYRFAVAIPMDAVACAGEHGQLTALAELHLSSNHLTSVPESIGQLTALRKLDLSHNQISHIPEWIFKLNIKGLNVGEQTGVNYFQSTVLVSSSAAVWEPSTGACRSCLKQKTKTTSTLHMKLHTEKTT